MKKKNNNQRELRDTVRDSEGGGGEHGAEANACRSIHNRWAGEHYTKKV
jgi:hypothetical protein